MDLNIYLAIDSCGKYYFIDPYFDITCIGRLISKITNNLASCYFSQNPESANIAGGGFRMVNEKWGKIPISRKKIKL